MRHRIRANFTVMQSFMDRVVLITGASGGLGTAVTRAFLTAGASVIGVARSLEAAPNLGPCFMPQPADLSLPAGAEETVAAAFARTGRIDCLVHLMGGFAGGQPVAQTTDETWTRMIDTNLNSAFWVARAVLPKMLAAGYGRIVTVGSRTAVEPAAGLSAYGVAKAGLVALTRTIAAEVKGTGVTANIILPSVIDTPSNRAGNATGDHAAWVKPESIAELILWLASIEAADVNGAVIQIYGSA
jgi:NAD(P)-dependent dehydrogenase (short-subunit alcohol dehydrogenase family)